MYNRAFLFNGIGSKPEKLLVKLPPELMDKYEYYLETAFGRLGLNMDLEKNKAYDGRVAEWIISLICDRVVFEHYIDKGIIPDIGAGYSSGIVSISSCFGSVSHEFAHDIIMMNRATMRCLERNNEKLDMGIVIGFSYSDIEEMFKDKFSPDEIVIGSGNSRFHVMVSGRADAVERALLLCQNEGAIKAFSFGTGVAYHHPVMKKYSQEYVDFCGSIEYNAPVYPILSIFDREIMTEGRQVMRENQLNVYTPIRWDLAIKKLEDLGVTEFFDVSANGAVSKFSRVSRKCKIYTLEDM
jgi:malonyl CoA-acyl carrier protein transacylase